MAPIRWLEWYGFIYGCLATAASAVLEVACLRGYHLPDSPDVFQYVFVLQFVPLLLVCSPSILVRRPVIRPTSAGITIARAMLAISALQIVGLLSWLAVAARIQHADDNMLIYIMTLELSSVLFFSSAIIACGWAFSWPEIFSRHRKSLRCNNAP